MLHNRAICDVIIICAFLSLSCNVALSLLTPRLDHHRFGSRVQYCLYGKSRDWLKREDEYVIDNNSNIDASHPLSNGDGSLFDELYRMDDMNNRRVEAYSISKQSLRAISESYQFSLAYLSDFVTELGCSLPLDIDTSISNILTGEQIYTLLQALTSLDPYDSNAGYDTISISELADVFNVTVDEVIKICKDEGISLPFGTGSILHKNVVEQISRLLEFNRDNIDGLKDSGSSNEVDPRGRNY